MTRRPLNLFDRLVKAPLGLLYLGFLFLLAVPVCVWMSLLYAAVSAARSIRPGSGGAARES